MKQNKRQAPKLSGNLENLEEDKITTLKAIRETLGLSQFDFCKETDLAITSVSKCENGKSEMLFDINQGQKFEILLRTRIGLSIIDLPKSLKSPPPADFLRKLREIQRRNFINV